jgi:hypothetical protein
MPSSLAGDYKRFGGTYRFHLQGHHDPLPMWLHCVTIQKTTIWKEVKPFWRDWLDLRVSRRWICRCCSYGLWRRVDLSITVSEKHTVSIFRAAVFFSETLVSTYTSTQRQNPEYQHRQGICFRSKIYKFVVTFFISDITGHFIFWSGGFIFP